MSMEKDKIAYEQLLQGIQSYVNKCLAESNRDITTTGKIVGIVEDGGYTVEINGVQYSDIDTIGGECTLNEMVKIVIPQSQYNNMFILKGGSGSSSGGTSVSGVSSVNGQTSTVTLKASDVGALPSTTKIPSKTSDLINDNGYVVDDNYVHTDNNYTTADKEKLSDTVNNTDFNALKNQVNTNEDNIVMLDSDIEELNTDVGTLKTDMTTVKGAVTTIQDDYVSKTRTINGKALSEDILLSANDIQDFPTSLPANGGTANYLKTNELISSTNLNNITTSGFYYCPLNATVAGFSNCPTKKAFFMLVGKHTGFYQEITEYMTASPKKYMRNYYAGKWGSWYRIYTTADPPQATMVWNE